MTTPTYALPAGPIHPEDRPNVTPKQVAAMFEVGETTALLWMTNGTLPSFKVGKKYRRTSLRLLKEYIASARTEEPEGQAERERVQNFNRLERFSTVRN